MKQVGFRSDVSRNLQERPMGAIADMARSYHSASAPGMFASRLATAKKQAQSNNSPKGMKVSQSPSVSVAPSRTSASPSAQAALRSTPELWLA